MVKKKDAGEPSEFDKLLSQLDEELAKKLPPEDEAALAKGLEEQFGAAPVSEPSEVPPAGQAPQPTSVLPKDFPPCLHPVVRDFILEAINSLPVCEVAP